jgi:hypothetical protein
VKRATAGQTDGQNGIRKPEEREHLGYLGIYRRIILK